MKANLPVQSQRFVTRAMYAALDGHAVRSSAVTTVKPHGEWMTSADRTARLHRWGWVVALWTDHGTFYGGRAMCGWRFTTVRLFVEPPDDLEFCDDCLFVGEHTVYRYFDIDDALVYVGYSSSPVKRMNDHRRSAPWWPLVYRGTYEVFADEVTARAAETTAIEAEKPFANLPFGPTGARRQFSLALAERIGPFPAPTP